MPWQSCLVTFIISKCFIYHKYCTHKSFIWEIFDTFGIFYYSIIKFLIFICNIFTSKKINQYNNAAYNPSKRH